MSNDNKNQQSTPPVAPATTGTSGGDSRPPATHVPNGGVPFKKGDDSPWKKAGE